MKKILSMVLVLTLLAALLSGCMCEVAETTLKAGGSGQVAVKFGFTEEMVDALDMRADLTSKGFTRFVYQGRAYYGDQATESFADPDEFNAIFSDVSDEVSEVDDAASAGTVTLALASDGGLTVSVRNTQSDRRNAIAAALAESYPELTTQEIDALLDGMVMTYRFTFPEAPHQYSEGTGITLEKSTVTLDFLTLPAGFYQFSTSDEPLTKERVLGTVTQENIPASGTARVRRQTIDVDGKPVTFQTYALVEANGGETNYVRLRDIASVLNGTSAQFAVDWDGSVVITPDQPYVSNGTEMKAPFSADRRYQKADAATKIYGESIPFTAILLTDDQGGGYTYYKLRDLGKVLNFNVDWSASRGIYIESNQPYAG